VDAVQPLENRPKRQQHENTQEQWPQPPGELPIARDGVNDGDEERKERRVERTEALDPPPFIKIARRVDIADAVAVDRVLGGEKR
jgi:hypothetical protein